MSFMLSHLLQIRMTAGIAWIKKSMIQYDDTVARGGGKATMIF